MSVFQSLKSSLLVFLMLKCKRYHPSLYFNTFSAKVLYDLLLSLLLNEIIDCQNEAQSI